MANVKFKWNRDALHEIRTSPEAAEMVHSYLETWCQIANSMGKGTYKFESHQGKKKPQGRWRGTVYTADWRAMRDNQRNNTLARVANSGR